MATLLLRPEIFYLNLAKSRRVSAILEDAGVARCGAASRL
jgi:hypothetical protein